ncbi:MAG TPA: hypothetical protein VFL64_21215 [Rhizobacter sp.]|nr:hypothetical protein [Rhizobacter sp.]
MSTETPQLPRHVGAPPEGSFEQLRAEGLRLCQALSGEIWTDYNVHDPGVTMLEQACYGLTGLIYRADFSVEDQLTGPDGEIDFERHALHPPQEVFPCRATTLADYRRLLLDRVAGLEDVSLVPQPPPTSKARALPGLVYLVVKPSGSGPADPALLAEAARAYAAQRNLCEDLHEEVCTEEQRLCDLHAEIELTGPRDAVEVLAEVYDRCARHVIASPRLLSLEEALRRHGSLERVFDGPLTQHGVLDDLAEHGAMLFVSDLVALVQQVDGVKEVRRLALQRGDAAPVSGSLPWRGPGWALRLRVPGGTGEVSLVRLTRRGSVVQVSQQEVSEKYADLRAASQARRQASQNLAATAPQPRGQHLPPQPYYPVQNQFPPIYELGPHSRPTSGSPHEQARVLQLKAYLSLFDQVMANGAAQLDHLRDLYAVDGAPRQSYWWELLADEAVPGLASLYRRDPQEIEQRAFARFDHPLERKSRVLDHLLALHGQTYSQNSMRQFCGHHSPGELEALLLANKAAYLQDIVSLSRDRCGGHDITQPLWDPEHPERTPALQRRVSLLLGFRYPQARSLALPLRRQNRELVDVQLHADEHPSETWQGEADPRWHRVAHEPGVPERRAMLADLMKIRPLRQARLSEAFFRVAAQRERYWLVDAADASSQRLLLGPDEAGRWWPLGSFADTASASRAAASLRQFVLHLSHESEGLHLVEHLLLRPIGRSPGHERLKLSDAFYALRLSVVFPAWTVRSHEPNFRRLAQETVQLNLPAHVAARCLWLDFAAMNSFEACWSAWLQARMDHAQSPQTGSAERVNQAACRVIECLQREAPHD